MLKLGQEGGWEFTGRSGRGGGQRSAWCVPGRAGGPSPVSDGDPGGGNAGQLGEGKRLDSIFSVFASSEASSGRASF